MKLRLIPFFLSVVLAQFPIQLNQNEITEPYLFTANSDSEFLLTVSASSNTDWLIEGLESANLMIAIDGDWENYNQDIIIYQGQDLHDYNISLGPINEGEHSIEFKFDYNKSSPESEHIYIESINLTDMNNLNVDPDVIAHSPILYGRDILSWNESSYTDIPLIMWHELSTSFNTKTIKYSIIFSNEDSRVGIGLADLMFSYGRTTDIEWVYEVTLDNNSNIISEIFQGASHITTDFNGNKIGRHPILKNTTLNCNFNDVGISDYKFFLSPIFTLNDNVTRENLMDQNPWTFEVMGKELEREGRYEEFSNPESVEISDVRNYIYIDYEGSYLDGNTNYNHPLDLIIQFHSGCQQYIHDHNFQDFEQNYYGGVRRTSIELFENFNFSNIESLTFITDSEIVGNIQISDISKIFYLNENYEPVDININFNSFLLNSDNSSYEILINNNIANLDCFGISNGIAECDECSVCDGNNIDLDDCGICFGENQNQDCNGDCFGSAVIDECGDCNGNNLSCSGCTDSNADNFDEEAIFYDDSCIYSDNIFSVPDEYLSIQEAINYSTNGDTIEVDVGTYYENIDFQGKSIVVKSLYDSSTSNSNFIISGIDSVSTITIADVEGDAALMGFTISGGYGNGISFDDFISMAADSYMLDSLVNNVIKGGGISVINSSPYIKDVHIRDNISRNVGAGIGLVNSNSVIESSTISNNIILEGDALGGGGIAINGGSPKLIDVEIFDNWVGANIYSLNGGGGILCGFSSGETEISLDIENSKIINNVANIGAGIGVLSGEVKINRTIIADNNGDYGSAISMGEPLGLVVQDIYMDLSNSTIANNSGAITTGLINSANLNIINSLFWGNQSNYEISNLPNNSILNVQASYSLFEQDLIGEENIIGLDPLFFDSDSQNFTLQTESPCIDAGTLNVFDEVILEYYGQAPDIGAFEYYPVLGDVNGDLEISILDIIIIIEIIIEDYDPSNQEYMLSDFNQDSFVDIVDIVQLVNFILE